MNVGRAKPASSGPAQALIPEVDLRVFAESRGIKLPAAAISADVAKAIMEVSMMTASSISALGPAMAAFKGTTSPQLARAIQATENAWKGVEAEYGLLGSMEVARLIGSGKSGRSFASDQHAAGKLIGIKRGNKVLYPGFQFDRASGKAHASVPALLGMAK
ncbi:hypothetical protein AB4Y88_11155, partial [Paenarthrobacter sp. RAF9]